MLRHILKQGNLKINDQGHVDVTFNNYHKKKPNGEFEIYGSIIRKKTDYVGADTEFDEYFFEKKIHFKKDGSQSIIEMSERLLQEQKNLLEIELMYQHNLPENMKDSTRSEKLIESINNLKQKQANVVRQDIINNKTLLVNCGRFIKYARIEVN